jgi:hypothetical protein
MKEFRSTANLLLFIALTPPLIAAEIYVSPGGDDSQPGTLDKPLATIARARDVAREIDGEPVTIYLRGGTYYLGQPVVFAAEDSGTKDAPVVYAAYEDETPVVSGGELLKAKWSLFKDGILLASVPEGFTTDQLFCNGERQHMARYPNFDPAAQYFGGVASDCISPQRAARWQDPRGGFFHAMHSAHWGDMHYVITGKDEKGNVVYEGGWQNNRQSAPHKAHRFVENIFEELDAPGEWFLDKTAGRLYFYPPEGVDPNSAKIEAVRLEQLFEFRGAPTAPVRHITLRGLTLTHTARTFMKNKEPLLRSDWTTWRGGAVFFDGAEDCRLENLTIRQAGSNAVFVNNYNRRIDIDGCHITEAGASSISFVGDPDALRSPRFEYHQTRTLEEMDRTPGPKTPNYPAQCRVNDCLLTLNGRFEKQTAGVNICMAEEITVSHCSIYDCPRAGINICDGAFGGHLIEHNDVFDTVKETGDHGSFNSWGRDRFWHPNRGQTAEWLKQHPEMPKWDCGKTIVMRNNRWRCDHGWDIDLDDGSSNYELYNNLCLAGGIKLREGYFRKVYNNIMVDWTFCPHVWYPDCHTAFTRNIIWQDGYRPAGMRTTDQTESIDYNLAHEAGAAPRPAETLPKFGCDKHSVVGDAMFVDPSVGDYRVEEGSPALELGFENFPMDQFGVKKPELKRLAKTPPLPGSLEAATVRTGGWDRRYSTAKTANWLGAKIKNIENDDEMSAVGLGDKNGVLVTLIRKNSRAQQIGLKENDVIRAVNDQPVNGLSDLAKVYEKQPKAKPITLSVWRNQTEHSLQIPAK